MTETPQFELVQVSGAQASWQIRCTDTGVIVERLHGAAEAARRLDELNHPQQPDPPSAAGVQSRTQSGRG